MYQKPASTVVIGDEDVHLGPLETTVMCTKRTILTGFASCPDDVGPFAVEGMSDGPVNARLE